MKSKRLFWEYNGKAMKIIDKSTEIIEKLIEINEKSMRINGNQ